MVKKKNSFLMEAETRVSAHVRIGIGRQKLASGDKTKCLHTPDNLPVTKTLVSQAGPPSYIIHKCLGQYMHHFKLKSELLRNLGRKTGTLRFLSQLMGYDETRMKLL